MLFPVTFCLNMRITGVVGGVRTEKEKEGNGATQETTTISGKG